MDIPLELLEQFERGNVLLFVGERIARAADGRTWIERLSADLMARCVDLGDASPAAFPEAAQAYQDAHGRQALVQFLREQFDAPATAASSAPRLIAGLAACEVLATTCIDRQLETAFAAANRPLNVVTGNVDVAFADARQATLYKLRGTLEQPESLVLTEDDYEAFFDDRTGISLVLQAQLATKTVLFVGYDLDDPHFKRLYRKVTAPLDNYARRAYAFGDTPPPQVCRWCERHGINVVPADATTFLEVLTARLAARKRPAPAPAPSLAVDTGPVALPVRPYKLLDYYEAQDAAIFFGRLAETHQLTSLIHAHRLTLLYGASGTGKTSLLLAGAVPRLETADPAYVTVHVRALEDPAQGIRRAVERKVENHRISKRVNEKGNCPAAQPLATHNPDSTSLVDFLHVATQTLGSPLVIILDQFEEFFIRLSPEFRRAFIAELGALYDARDVPVKVVLSLREDWLASINELEQRIPEVFRTRMRLLPLTRDQAQEAITAPVTPLGVTYEPALVERLLDDLTGETAIMPPQLQLVCSALYDGLPAGQMQIALAAYAALGGARGVLQAYLDAELAHLVAAEQGLARDLLEELVTSERTKAVKTGAELAQALGVNAVALTPVLEKLVRARLLRVLERDTTGRAYELAHEYLIAEIVLSPEAVARKEAEELLRQGVENYRRFDVLLSLETLTLIAAQRDRLRLDADAQTLLLRSALRYGRDVGDWLARMEDEGTALDFLVAASLTSTGVTIANNLKMTAPVVSPARLNHLITRLATAWQQAKGTSRIWVAEVLWALKVHLPHRLRLKLRLARAPQTLRRLALPLGGVLLGAVLIALVVWGPRWLSPKPDIAWADIPAGTFRMGSDPAVDSQADDDEMPQHDVTLDAFRIAKYEVTNAEYADCVNATVCEEPAELQDYQDPAYANHPMVNVSWYDAVKFCAWIGGRLPTEAEWEYAARGDTGYIYPWGNADPTCELVNYSECGWDTMPVGSLPDGASPFGVMDLAGNVWEWVADWYGEYSKEAQVNPTGPGSGRNKVLRGGAFYFVPSSLRAAYRGIIVPDNRHYYVGFRCVRESPGK